MTPKARSFPKKRQREISVQIYQPVLLGSRFVQTIDPYAVKYRHRNRLYGGFWTATWEMENMTPDQKKAFFMRRLGHHVLEKSGNTTTWEGLIWEMEFYQAGITRRMTLDQTRNKVACIYIDVSDDNRKQTSWYSNAASIDRYGEIQEIVYLDKTTTTAAQKYAQTILAEQATPYPEIVSVKEPQNLDDTTLRVTAVGYAYTMNYQYLSIASTSDTISNKISTVLSTNCPIVSAGSIASNTIQVAPPDNEVRAWDWLLELANIGDGSIPYTIQVTPGRRVLYKALSPTPNITWRENRLSTRLGRNTTTNKWAMAPGILRDYTWHSQPLPTTMFLADTRDTIVTEIEAAENYDIPLLKTERYDESDFLTALAKAMED